MTFTGEENDDGYFSLTTTFSLKPTIQTSNPLSGVLIGISENNMETTGIILLKQICNQVNIWLWFERLKIPTKTDFNKCIFFFFWKASQNMVKYQENPQACFNNIDEGNWGNHETMTIDKNSGKYNM